MEVNLFREKIDVKIPAGTQPGEVLRVKNGGMPVMNSNSKGDLHVRVLVSVPKHLSSREKELISELGNFGQKKHSWFSR